jgi:hypothetical protein
MRIGVNVKFVDEGKVDENGRKEGDNKQEMKWR